MGRKLDGKKNIVAAGELTVVQYIEGEGGGGGGASDTQYIIRDEWRTQGVRNFSQPMTLFTVENKGSEDVTFTIGSLTMVVKSTETFTAAFDPFSQVTITAVGVFEASVSSAESAPETSAKYAFSGSASVTKAFTSPVTHLAIVNDGGSTISYSVNGTAFTVEPGEAHARYFGSFTSVFVTAAVPFRAYVEGAYQVPISELGSAPPPVDPPPVDTNAPADVQNLQATNVSSNSLTLTWNASVSSDVASYEVYRGATLMATIAGTTYTVTGLSPSTSYTFMVKARDTSGNVSAGSSVTQTTAAPSTDSTPPANVQGLQATNIASTSCTLSWQANTESDIKDYRVYNGTTLLATVTATTYSVTGLTASTGYTFVVKSRDTSNNEASGSPVGVTTTAAPPVPATPSAPTATAKSAKVDLTWPAVSNATSYKVYRGATLVASPTTNSYTDTGLTNGTPYSYTVSAVNATGESAQSAAATATPILRPVTNLAAGTPASTSVPLTWTLSASTDVANYEVAYSTGGAFTVVSAAVNKSSTSYTVTGLTASTAYTFRVVALDGAGNSSTAATVQATTASGTPSLAVTSSNPTPAGSTLSWPSVTDASSYSIYNGATQLAKTATNTSYNVAGLLANTAYTLTVRAKDSAGADKAEGNVSFTTGAFDTNGPSLYLLSDDLLATQITAADGVLWQDRSGKGYNTRITKGWAFPDANWPSGWVDAAKGLNGVDIAWTDITNNITPFTTRQWTWELQFFSPATTSSALSLLTAQGVYGFLLQPNGDILLQTQLYTVYTPSSTLYTGTERHLVVTLNGTEIKIYLDGVLGYTGAAPNNNPLGVTKIKPELGAVTRRLRFYERVLTDAEVTANYNAVK